MKMLPKILKVIYKSLFINLKINENYIDLTKMTPEELETFLKMKKNKILGSN